MQLSRETQLELLKSAKALVEKGWTQDTYAVDEDGDECSIVDGACFCTLGAWIAAGWELDVIPLRKRGDFEDQLVKLLPIDLPIRTSSQIADWNDTEGRTQAEVVAAFDAAISRLEG